MDTVSLVKPVIPPYRPAFDTLTVAQRGDLDADVLDALRERGVTADHAFTGGLDIDAHGDLLLTGMLGWEYGTYQQQRDGSVDCPLVEAGETRPGIIAAGWAQVALTDEGVPAAVAHVFGLRLDGWMRNFAAGMFAVECALLGDHGDSYGAHPDAEQACAAVTYGPLYDVAKLRATLFPPTRDEHDDEALGLAVEALREIITDTVQVEDGCWYFDADDLTSHGLTIEQVRQVTGPIKTYAEAASFVRAAWRSLRENRYNPVRVPGAPSSQAEQEYLVTVRRTEVISYTVMATSAEDARDRYLGDGNEEDSRTSDTEVLSVLVNE